MIIDDPKILEQIHPFQRGVVVKRLGGITIGYNTRGRDSLELFVDQ